MRPATSRSAPRGDYNREPSIVTQNGLVISEALPSHAIQTAPPSSQNANRFIGNGVERRERDDEEEISRSGNSIVAFLAEIWRILTLRNRWR